MRRLFNFLDHTFQLRAFASDVFHSRESQKGLITALGGAAVLTVPTPFSMPAAVLAFGRGVQLVAQGATKSQEARKQAFTDTLAWVKRTAKQEGGYPNLMETFHFYELRVDSLRPGAYAGGIDRFAEQLQVNNL
jgi:hypothetical protein